MKQPVNALEFIPTVAWSWLNLASFAVGGCASDFSDALFPPAIFWASLST